jgi:hypothetical protein
VIARDFLARLVVQDAQPHCCLFRALSFIFTCNFHWSIYAAAGLQYPQRQPRTARLPSALLSPSFIALICLKVVSQANMAAIEAVPHVSAQIHVNGTPVTEYDNDDNEDTGNAITKYVESTTGANFSIQYHIKPAFQPKHDVVVRANVDGKYCDSHVHRAVSLVEFGGFTGMFTGIREITGAGHFLRKSVFSEVQISKFHPE